MEWADVHVNSTPAAGSGDLLLEVWCWILITSSSPKKRRKILMYSTSKPILCVQSSRVTWEKCFCTFIQPPLQGQDSCSSHRDHCGEAHRTSSLFLPKQGSCILQQPRRQDVQLWPQGTDSFSPVRSQGPACTYQTTVTHTKGMGKTHGIRLVRAQATFIVASSFLAFI